MRCVVSTDGTSEEDLMRLLREWPGMEGRNLASEVSCKTSWQHCQPDDPRVRFTVVDGGLKTNILDLLKAAGCSVRVHPISDPAEAWLKDSDAVLVSNGPGDPAAIPGVVDELKKCIERGVPTVGICLGSQLLGLALGATTYKLKFGHRGANQPVQDLRTGKVEITSQNHGFAVDRASLEAVGAEVTHVHLNDQTVSGFWHQQKGVFAVQYHPESNPGPHDSRAILLEQFVQFAQERIDASSS
jgi:carbamoyl-phosphate synthase small subunit